MNETKRSELPYRDPCLQNRIMGPIALGMGAYLAFLVFGRGIPKLVQAPPRGNEWFVAIPIVALIILFSAACVVAGLMLFFGRQGAVFFTDPVAVELWYRWFRWKRVRLHSLEGYHDVEVRWTTAKHTYFYLVMRGGERPDLVIDTIYFLRRSDALAMAREVAGFLGWQRPACDDAPKSPNPDFGTT